MYKLPRRSTHLACVLLFCLTIVEFLSAHPLSVSYSHFVLTGDRVEAVYRLPMDDMDLLLQLDRDLDDEVTAAEIDAAFNYIEEYLHQRVEFSIDNVNVEGVLQAVGMWQDNKDYPYLEARVHYAPARIISSFDINVRVLTDLYPGHRNLAGLEFGEHTEQFVFQVGNSWSGDATVTSSWLTVRAFGFLGIEHIFTGYDHLLFLLGLLLVGRGLRNRIAIITSFTVAHSLTLGLATLGIVEPVPWMVEAAIALSIAYVGLENLVVREVRHRWRITFIFGLVHGFGFAGILQGMNLEQTGLLLSLFSFNIGVEIGQLIILVIFWPLLAQLTGSPYRALIVRLISTVIMIFGILWFFERIMP